MLNSSHYKGREWKSVSFDWIIDLNEGTVDVETAVPTISAKSLGTLIVLFGLFG